jgi:isoquinoline 1-oxidoreductase beta subunit
MTTSNLSRRKFLQDSAAAGGALVIGFTLPGCAAPGASAPTSTAMPNSWVRVGNDNSVTIICARSEMGQGVFTAMPMLIAEELDVDITKVKVDFAPAGEAYVNAMLGGQLTGGSTSVRDAYDKLRVAGAQARAVLVQAAANNWKVDPAACKTQDAWVLGPNGQKASYGELAPAAAKLTPPKEPALKPAGSFRYVGKPLPRFDTAAKVDGTAEFGIDAKVPGMKIAALAQCPTLGGKVVSFDASKAKGMPGVVSVVQVTDGVAVVANTYWQARQALSAVTIQWDESAGKGISSDAIVAKLKSSIEQPGATFKKQGDADAAMKSAAKVIEASYEIPFYAHATMEPMNFIADVRGDKINLVGPTQFQQLAQGLVAAALNVKPENVNVRTTFLGGGFGRRVDIDFILQAVEISKAAGVPVKLVWSREDDMTHDFYRPISYHKMAAGLDASGKPVALKFSVAAPSVTARLFSAFVKDGIDPFMLEAANSPYDVPNISNKTVITDTGVRVGYWRSVSHNVYTFANESFIDECAVAAGKDPVEYRRSLLGKEPRYLNVLNQVAAKANWGKPAAGQKQGVAVMEGYGTYIGVVADVSTANNDIKVHKITAVVDIGSMVNPNIVRQQIESSAVFGLTAALLDSITLKDGAVQQTNFHNYRPLRMNETPQIDITLIANGEAPGGIGEPITALMAPAVANGVFAATGKRLRKLPLRLA